MKKIFVALVVIAIIGGAYYYYKIFTNNSMSSQSTNPSPTTGEQVNSKSELASVEKYTINEVSTHNNKGDCWLVYEGKIYDVTPYVKSGFHPGKDAILMGCGKDATELFNNRPNGSGSHSERAKKMLDKYYKGELATE